MDSTMWLKIFLVQDGSPHYLAKRPTCSLPCEMGLQCPNIAALWGEQHTFRNFHFPAIERIQHQHEEAHEIGWRSEVYNRFKCAIWATSVREGRRQ